MGGSTESSIFSPNSSVFSVNSPVASFVSLIASARKNGEVNSSVDDKILSRYIEALIRSVLMEWKIAGKMGNTQDEIEQMILFMKNGLGIK